MPSHLLPWGIAASALLVCAYSYVERPARPDAATVTAHAGSSHPTARAENRRAREADDRPRSTRRPTPRRVEHDADAPECDELRGAEQPVDEDTRRSNESSVAAAHALTDRVIDRGVFSRADIHEVTALVARAPEDERAAILKKLGRAINGEQIAYVPSMGPSTDEDSRRE